MALKKKKNTNINVRLIYCLCLQKPFGLLMKISVRFIFFFTFHDLYVHTRKSIIPLSKTQLELLLLNINIYI